MNRCTPLGPNPAYQTQAWKCIPNYAVDSVVASFIMHDIQTFLCCLQMYYILELSELCKVHQGPLQDMYRREEKTTLELAKAVGRKLKGSGGPNDLTKGNLGRLQQLSKLGYLAVKRSKQDRQQDNILPARYPGWRGRPRYGPPTSKPLLPKLAQPPLPQPPQLPQPLLVGHPLEGKSLATAPAAVPPQPATQPLPTHQQLLPGKTPAGTKPTAAPQKLPTQASPLPTPTPAESRPSPPAFEGGWTLGDPFAPTPQPKFRFFGGLQSQTATSAARLPQATAAAQLPLLSQAPATAAPTHTPAVASVLALFPPSAVQHTTATAPTQITEPSSAHRPQQQQQQPVLSDATVALVAAVGPLFESFVAQTAAVVADPAVSLQTLAGSITQNLAAAIASAAVKVVAQRRQQQLMPTAGHPSADTPLTQALGTSALVKSLVPAGVLAPAVVGPTQAVHLSNTLALGNPTRAQDVRPPAAGFVGADQTAKSVVAVGSKQAQNCTGDGVADTGTVNAAIQAAGLNNHSGSNGGHRKRVAADSEAVVTSNVDQAHKQAGSSGQGQQGGGAKRQKTGVAALQTPTVKHGTRSDTSSSDKAQTGSISTPRVGNNMKGQKGGGRGSPASRGSGKSSPKDPYGSLDADFHSHRVASPLLVGRNSPGLSFQHVAAPALLPSRLSDSFGSASAILNGPMPFAPGHVAFPPSIVYTDMMSSPQADLATGFMPVLPSSPGDWHMHSPALNDFPMAAHFLPGIAEAPDFSPVD